MDLNQVQDAKEKAAAAAIREGVHSPDIVSIHGFSWRFMLIHSFSARGGPHSNGIISRCAGPLVTFIHALSLCFCAFCIAHTFFVLLFHSLFLICSVTTIDDKCIANWFVL